jgi:PAS domain S-box-containing protein
LDFRKSFLFRPGTLGAVTFILVMGITVYVAVKQRQLAFKEDREKLVVEMEHTKDHFRDVLYSDITVANSMSVIYREYGFKNNFDSIAKALISKSEYAQIIQLTVDGVITNVYPVAGYENTIGLNVSSDSIRQKEYQRAQQKKKIFFAGPRELRGGGTGILGKVPVILGDTMNALVVVLTRLDLIQRSMNRPGSDHSKYTYELIKKTPGTDTSRYYLSKTFSSALSPNVTVEIPEGDWTLSVSYADGYAPPPLPLLTLITGFGIALLGAVMVFRISNQNFILEKVVTEKTHDLGERIKELGTIYNVTTLLQEENSETGELMQKIANMLPSGWQYPESCVAQIKFDGQVYSSKDYVASIQKQRATFRTIDDKHGYLEVAYTSDKPKADEGPFLKEERALLNTLADHVLAYLNKRHEQESKARSQAQFRAGFEYAAIGMALVSLNNRWITVNHALCDMIGYTEDELIGTVVSDITHPDDREGDILSVQRALSGEIDYYRKEKRYVHKNGAAVWIRLNVALVRDKGEPLYFVGQIENITEKLEADLKFRDLVEKSMVGVYIIQNNKFAYVNPMIIVQSGYSETELLNMKIEEFVHAGDAEKVTENIKARITGEVKGIRYEIRAHRKSGEMIWVEMFGNNTIYQGKPAIIGTMVDITEKKRTFNELEKSEANLRSLFEATRISYMLLNDKLEIMTVNQYFSEAYKNQTGYSLTVGAYFPDQTIPSKREAIYLHCRNVIETGETVFSEPSYLNEDGSMNYFESTYTPVISNKEIIGLCYTGVDVTARKKAELERQNLLAERLNIIEDLTKRNHDLEQFSYIVSHNVRGPVATILGLSSMAKNTTYQPEVRHTAVDGIHKSASTLDSVLMDLNDILALRKNKSQSYTEVDLYEVAQTAVQMTTRVSERIHPKFHFDFNAAPSFYAIKSYVQNIFYNMISNAVKYAKPNTDPELTMWSELTETHCVLHFRDNGIGIDLEKHSEYIFGLYKRFHFSAEGKGMGLYMVKTQVESLDGSVKVESKPGEGAHFILSFKIKPKS